MNSRVENTLKNISWGAISSVVSMILNFIYRTVFIKYLGANYLGVNGLFFNILGVLSFAELGIGTVLNYNLYKPVANGDIEAIKTVMAMYKKFYTYIGLVVFGAGLFVYPFLDVLVKDPGDVGNIGLYYLISLFSTSVSYLLTYRCSLVNAEQKKYILTNIDTITNIVSIMSRIAIVIITHNYLLCLIAGTIIEFVRMVVLHIYLGEKYRFLKDKNIEPMPQEKKQEIRKNVIALVWHKMGDVLINSTDNIIISAFISIRTVGLLLNYTLIKNAVNGFVKMIFFGAIPSIGNLVATTDLKKQYSVFKTYNFLSFWIYGFCSIAFYTLSGPFITLWLGESMLISDIAWLLICIDYYLLGQRIAFQNYKTGFGIFYDDQYVVIASFVINLVISIVGAIYLGITGVFLGTIISGLYQSIRRPMIAFTRITGEKTIVYFKYLMKYLISVIIPGIILKLLSVVVLKDITIIRFVVLCLLVAVIPNLFFYALYRNEDEFSFLKNIVVSIVCRITKKGRRIHG